MRPTKRRRVTENTKTKKSAQKKTKKKQKRKKKKKRESSISNKGHGYTEGIRAHQSNKKKMRIKDQSVRSEASCHILTIPSQTPPNQFTETPKTKILLQHYLPKQKKGGKTTTKEKKNQNKKGADD